MIKKIFLLLILVIRIPFVNADEIDITSSNVILYNMNDNIVLYEKNSDEKTSIASLTKIMTAIVAIENNDNLDEKVVIKANMLDGLTGYSIIGLKTGNVVTVKDLLYGALLPSGADAVNALAYHTSGSINAFVDLMNQKAKALGLNNTSFQNPVGMDDENNYSTASDVAKLLQYCLNNQVFKEIFTTRDYKIESLGLSLKSTIYGYASPLRLDISNITGAKSGFTYDAGYCLASIATFNDVNFLLINIGSDTSSKANAVKDSLAIYEYFDANYGYQEILAKNTELKVLPIKLGKEKEYVIKSNETIELYLKKDLNLEDILYEYDGIEEINSKIKKGDKLGIISIMLDNEALHTFDVFLESDIEYHNLTVYVAFVIGGVILLFLFKKGYTNRKNRRK